jgi:hypothetical protein
LLGLSSSIMGFGGYRNGSRRSIYARGYGLGSIRHKSRMLEIIEIQYLDLSFN